MTLSCANLVKQLPLKDIPVKQQSTSAISTTNVIWLVFLHDLIKLMSMITDMSRKDIDVCMHVTFSTSRRKRLGAWEFILNGKFKFTVLSV